MAKANRTASGDLAHQAPHQGALQRQRRGVQQDAVNLAHECLRLAEAGLKRRANLDHDKRDESRYLAPLQEFVARGITPADELLEKYRGPWGGSVEPVFDEYAY